MYGHRRSREGGTEISTKEKTPLGRSSARALGELLLLIQIECLQAKRADDRIRACRLEIPRENVRHQNLRRKGPISAGSS